MQEGRKTCEDEFSMPREFQYKVLVVADPRFDFKGVWSLLTEGV